MSEAAVQALVAALEAARLSRRPIPPPSATWPGMTLADAYAVQRRWAAVRGRTRIGYKVAMTSPGTQRALRTDRPGYGIFLDDMLFAEGESVPADRFIRPRLEMELAFVMRETPPPGCTVEQALAAVDHVSPAFEIVDSRCEMAGRIALDIIADGGATAGLMLSARRYDPRAQDLGRIGATLDHNGAIEESGLFAVVMGAPERAVHWLATVLAEEGDSLLPGDIILCGSAIKAWPAASGDRFTADFGAFGRLSIAFDRQSSPIGGGGPPTQSVVEGYPPREDSAAPLHHPSDGPPPLAGEDLRNRAGATR